MVCNEIIDMIKKQPKMTSTIAFIVIKFYERNISSMDFLKAMASNGDNLGLALRILFVMLQSFEELKLI